MLTLARQWTGTELAARAVGFRHPRPAGVEEDRRMFGCAPTSGADTKYVVIPDEVLGRELHHGDRLLAAFFDSHLDELAKTMANSPGPLAKVREAILRALPDGAPTVAS